MRVLTVKVGSTYRFRADPQFFEILHGFFLLVLRLRRSAARTENRISSLVRDPPQRRNSNSISFPDLSLSQLQQEKRRAESRSAETTPDYRSREPTWRVFVAVLYKDEVAVLF